MNLGFPKVGSCFFFKKVFGCRGHWLSVVFGIGNFLTNDFRSLSSGEKSQPLMIVIKLSSVNNRHCIKISDDVTKVRIVLVKFSYRT